MAYKDVILNDKQENDLYPVTRTSNVYDSSNHNLDELLAGKQASLSTSQLNAVNSGVTSSTVAQVATNTTNISQLSNPNLLINGDFRVNQRGQTTYNNTNAGSSKYTVDRWIHYISGDYTLTPIAGGGITIVNSHTTNVDFAQIIEDGYNLLNNKTVTLSAKVNGVIYSVTATPTNNGTVYNVYAKTNGVNTLSLAIQCTTSNVYKVFFQTFSGSTNIIDWIKLEVGSVATPFSPRPYAEELALCQRYYVKFNESSTRFPANTVTTTQARVIIILPVPLRTVPTITAPNYTSGNLCYGGAVHDLVSPAPNHYVLDNNIETITVTTTNITYANTGMCNFGGNLEFDAEIY